MKRNEREVMKRKRKRRFKALTIKKVSNKVVMVVYLVSFVLRKIQDSSPKSVRNTRSVLVVLETVCFAIPPDKSVCYV